MVLLWCYYGVTIVVGNTLKRNMLSITIVIGTVVLL
jgi:hypothetical protein